MLLFFSSQAIYCLFSIPFFFAGLLFFPFRPGSKRETISKRKLAREKMKQKQKQKMFGRTQMAPSLNVTAHAWLVPNAAWKSDNSQGFKNSFCDRLRLNTNIEFFHWQRGYVAMQIYSHPEY